MHAVAPNCSEGAGNKVSQDAAEPIMEGLMSRILARADSLNFEAITVPAIGMGSYKVDTARGTAKLCKAVGTWARDRSLFQPLSNIDFVVTSTELFDQFIKCMPDGSSEVNDFIAGNR